MPPTRRPLSNAEEEPLFQREDAYCEAVGVKMRDAILRRMAAAGASMHRPSLALALTCGSASAVRIAFNAQAAAHVWASELLSDEAFTVKAGKGRLQTEAEIIQDAIDAGIEIGLEKLPAKIRADVDEAAARRLTRQRLLAGMFRQNLAAYNESVRGIETLASAARTPALATLLDVERLASMFGLNARQAASLVREATALYEYVPEGTKRRDDPKRLNAIRKAMAKRVRQALEARAETLGQTMAREAISTAQSALFETAQRQGLLDEDKQKREWVTRHDDRVCPICDSVDGVIADIDQEFEAEDGSTFFQPPAHPRCRCSIRLVTIKTPKRATRRRAAA